MIELSNSIPYQPGGTGSYWNSPIKPSQFLACLICLFFPGIVKASRTLIKEWLGKYKRLLIYKETMIKVYETVPLMKLD